MYQDDDNMNPMCNNDMLFTDICGDQSHINSDLPHAMRVSLSEEDDGHGSLLTPPDSPVLAELTPPSSNHPKGPMLVDGVVPELFEFNNPCDNNYMNTMYSPLFPDKTTFYEGVICDDPIGSSNDVFAMQVPDSYFNDSTLQWNQGAFNDYTYEYFPVAPPFESPIDMLPSVGQIFMKNPMEGITSTNLTQRGHNSAGEDTEFESESEASFTLPNSPATSDDAFLSVSRKSHPGSHRHRTHNYQCNTIDKSLSLLGGVTNKSNKRGRGRPRKIDSTSTCSEDSDEEITTRRGRGRREAMRGNHLWEFIRDLLKDSVCCPKYIRWEDRKDGVFRFVNSDAVSRLWGQKKNNPQMTYEKLSRAMRYYYKREILERVDGRRLVYKFGKKATGWREAAGLDTQNHQTKI